MEQLLVILFFCVGFTQTYIPNLRSGRQVQVAETCTTPNEGEGVCIPVKQCPQLMEMIRNSRDNRIVRQFLLKSHCRGSGSRTSVCCPTEYTNLLDPPICGVSEFTDAIKIFGGSPSILGAWPWIAALGYRNKTSNVPHWKCSGVLINKRYVLTAAHCMLNLNSLQLYLVRLGDLDLANETDGATPIDAGIEKLIRHQQYRLSSRTHDIGLIRLDQDIPFSSLIKPICLPKTATLRRETFDYYFPFVAGWGATSFRGNSSSHLLEVQIPVLPNANCSEIFSSLKQKINSRDLCAGELKGKKDSCTGDSGGPLMWPNNNIFYTIGVVSMGLGCGTPGFPGLYTRVTEYIEWISSNIE